MVGVENVAFAHEAVKRSEEEINTLSQIYGTRPDRFGRFQRMKEDDQEKAELHLQVQEITPISISSLRTWAEGADEKKK